MPVHSSLEELFRHAVTFPGPAVFLAGLETALNAVEEELAHARDQATIRLGARHKRDGDVIHPDDRELELYELEVTVDQILPRVFRGGFVLTLWSVFEVVAKHMGEYAYKQREMDFDSKLFRRGNFLKEMDKVYSQHLGVVAFPQAEELSQLDDLRELRNALIHHNGSVAALPYSLRRNGKEEYAAIGLHLYRDVHREYVIPNDAYLPRNYELVQARICHACLATAPDLAFF